LAHDSQGSGNSNERRRAPRFHVEAQVRYMSGSFEGTGVITELSKVGLRIENASLRVPAGQRIRVSFALMRTSIPIVIPCVVARTWDRGLAVEFAGLDARHRNSLHLALTQLRRRQQREDDETGLTILRSERKRRRGPV
jgi:hypothetical protein